MKINTAFVKNKKYESAIKPCILKHSQEYRVLATLRHLYPEKYDNMITGESPDLQDFANSVGIEVTTAVKENDMRVSRAFSELCQGHLKDTEKRKKIIESSGYSFVPLVDNKIAVFSSGTSDGEKHYFQGCIRRKTRKLQQYRKDYKKIGLAILLPEIPTSFAEAHLIEWISELQNEASNSFDFIYVISHRFCLYYDIQTNVTEKHSLTSEESWLLSTIGRMTAEGEMSLSDPEWL